MKLTMIALPMPTWTVISAPPMIRLRMSRPAWSRPSGCCGDGGWYVGPTACSHVG